MVPPAATVAVLGDDLLREVFILLPTPTDLLRAALACKPFLRAARSATFLRRFRRRHPFTCPRLLGCLLPHPSGHPGTRPLHLLPAYPDAPATHRIIEGGDPAFSFLPRGGRPEVVGNPWQLMDSRNGRVLLLSRASRELAVADLLTWRWVSLPARPGLGYALVADDGDSSVFKAVCISRRIGSPGLRAFLLSSADLRWAQVAVCTEQSDLAGSRAMQANRSLYWKLAGGERMVAFNTATMELTVLELPPFSREISFDVIEKGEDGAGGLYLLTMRGFCIEVWVGVKDGAAAAGGLTWTLVEKSVRFHRAMAEMIGSELFHQLALDVIGVVAGVVFLRNGDCLFSINLETMKMTRMSPKVDCPSHLIYPYTIAWPPSFLSQTEQGA